MLSETESMTNDLATLQKEYKAQYPCFLFLSQSAHAALAQELHGLIDSETDRMLFCL